MEKSKVVQIKEDVIIFDDGTELFSGHETDCCESHYLDFEHISLSDFEGLEFDLNGDEFFERIEDYGIELIPIKGHSVKIPGYGYNKGWYSDNLELVLKNGESIKVFDITECQTVYDD